MDRQSLPVLLAMLAETRSEKAEHVRLNYPNRTPAMPLDYHLSPDSPLLQPDAPERLFGDPGQYVFCQRMKDLRELGFGPDKLFSRSYTDDITAVPVYSVLTQEEVDELLTPAGAVWYLSQATELDVWGASRLYEAGTPWPLRPLDDDLQWAKGFLKKEQIDYLSRLFQPVGRHGQIIIELEANGWEAPKQPDGGPVKQVRAYWKHVAKETNEDIRMVRWAARTLHAYYDCIQRFVKQQRLNKSWYT